MEIGACRMTPGQRMRSPLATVADDQSRATRRPLPNEVVGGSCVQEGHQRRGAQGHPNLHGVTDGNARHCLQREDWSRDVRVRICSSFLLVGESDAVDEEYAATDPVVTPGVLLATVVAEAEATPFRLLFRRQPLDRLVIGPCRRRPNGRSRKSRPCRWSR